MNATNLNPLTVARELESVGVERRQAEAIVNAINHGDERAATKADLESAIAGVHSELSIIRWVVGIRSAIGLGTFAIVAAKLL